MENAKRPSESLQNDAARRSRDSEIKSDPIPDESAGSNSECTRIIVSPMTQSDISVEVEDEKTDRRNLNNRGVITFGDDDEMIPDLINTSSVRGKAVHSSQTGKSSFAGLSDDIPMDIKPPSRR